MRTHTFTEDEARAVIDVIAIHLEEDGPLDLLQHVLDRMRSAVPDENVLGELDRELDAQDPERRGPYTIAQWEDGSYLVHHDQRGEVGGAPDLQEARNLVEELLREEEVARAQASRDQASECARKAAVLAQEEIEGGGAA